MAAYRPWINSVNIISVQRQPFLASFAADEALPGWSDLMARISNLIQNVLLLLRVHANCHLDDKNMSS